MFGLSTKEKLTKLILEKAEFNKVYLKDNLVVLLEQQGDDVSEEAIAEVLSNYLIGVGDDVFDTFREQQPNVYSKIQMILMSPELCGYEDLDFASPYAGAIYAVSYTALTGKIASPNVCVELNHIQGAIINEIMAEIDDIYSE